MKSLKTTTRNFVSGIQNWIVEIGNPLKDQIEKKFRLKGKIRLLNMKLRHRPKLLLFSFLGFMAFLFFIDTVATLHFKKNNSSDKEAAPVIVPLAGIQRIQKTNEDIKSYISMLINEGLAKTARLDSLNKIENKTRRDSIEMIELTKELNTLSKLLDHEHEEN